jgi:hypothetical protein
MSCRSAMNAWRELLLRGVLYTLLTLLVTGIALRVEGWLFRILLGL